MRVPQSCAGEQSCFLRKLFGDNECRIRITIQNTVDQRHDAKLNSAELERISINFGWRLLMPI